MGLSETGVYPFPWGRKEVFNYAFSDTAKVTVAVAVHIRFTKSWPTAN